MSEAQHCIALHTGGEVGGAVTEVEEIHGILQVRVEFTGECPLCYGYTCLVG
jgi:hypothetical protein